MAFQSKPFFTNICYDMAHIRKTHMNRSRKKSFFTKDFEMKIGRSLLSELLDITQTSDDQYRKTKNWWPYLDYIYFKEYHFKIGESFDHHTKHYDECKILKLVLHKINGNYVCVTAYPIQKLPKCKSYHNDLKFHNLKTCPNLMQQTRSVVKNCKCIKEFRQRHKFDQMN